MFRRKQLLVCTFLSLLVLLTLRSAAFAQAVGISPNELKFGKQVLNTTSGEQKLTLTNEQNSAVTISSIFASGEFAQTNNCEGTLAPGTSCTIRVTFTPTAVGSREGTLTIQDDSTSSSREISLSGTGHIAGGTDSSFGGFLALRTTGNIAQPSVAPSPQVIEQSGAKPFQSTVNRAFRPMSAATEILPLPPPTPPVKPRFAYAANFLDNTVSIYTVNSTTGQLRDDGYALTGTTPAAVAVDPSGSFLYVPNFSSNNISAYTINASNGALTPIAGSPFGTGTNPFAAQVDLTGKFLYVANSGANTISAYNINQTTGALTTITGSPFATGTNPVYIGIDPLGQFLYVANFGGGNVSGYSITASGPSAGALTALGLSPYPAGSGPFSIGMDPFGEFVYVSNFNGNNVSAYTITAGSGNLVAVSGSPFGAGTSPVSATLDPSGNFVYVGNFGSANVSAYTIDLRPRSATFGALIPVTGSPFPAGNGVLSVSSERRVAQTPPGQFIYVANGNDNTVQGFLIDPNTGALSSFGTVLAQSQPTSVMVSDGTAAVTYTPAFAYVADVTNNKAAGFKVDPATGTPTVAVTPFTTGVEPVSVASNPLGSFLYVVNAFDFTVSAYTINPSNGALSNIAGSPFGGGSSPFAAVVEPSGRFLYVANAGSGDVSAFKIDPVTGALSVVAGSPFLAGIGPFWVTVDPAGKFLYVVNDISGNVSAYTINSVTGALTAVGSPIATGTGPFTAAVDASGKFLYVANITSNNISAYKIDSGTGALTAIAGSPFTTGAGSIPVGVAADPLGKFLYVVLDFSFAIAVFRIDPSTGALAGVPGSPFAIAGSANSPFAAAVDPSGAYLFVTNAGSTDFSVFSINPSTGALTEITGSPFFHSSFVGGFPIAVTVTGTIQ